MKNKPAFRKIPVTVFLSIVLLAAVVPSVVSCSTPPDELSVFAAAGVKPALDEVCRMFEEKYGTAVEISYGGGGEVLSQMELSRSGDVYVAPEQGFMEKAVEKQLVDPATVTGVAYMIPVIAVPRDNPQNIKTLQDLANPGVRVAVTRQETTLLGRYAPEIFAKAGLADEIGGNIVTEAARPDNLLTMLAMGQVDAGIIWNFYEVQAADKITVIYLAPDQLTGVGEMLAAVSTFTDDSEGAGKFIEYLTSPAAKDTFRNLGYIVDEKEIGKYR